MSHALVTHHLSMPFCTLTYYTVLLAKSFCKWLFFGSLAVILIIINIEA